MIIKDKVLGQWVIKCDSNSYDVGTMKINKDNEEVFVADTFHTTMDGAVRKVIRLRLEKSLETLDLKMFLQKYKAIQIEITKSIQA